MEELKPKIGLLANEYRALSVTLKSLLEKFRSESNQDEIFNCVAAMVSNGDAVGMVDGAYQENERYKIKADAMKGVSGSHAFSRQEFETSAQNCNKKASDLSNEFAGLGGQLGMLQFSASQAAKNSPKREKLISQFAGVLKAYLETANEMAIYRGAANENMAYMRHLDATIQAMGGKKSEEVVLERFIASDKPAEAVK
jgi:hypothetical protein